MDTFMKRGEVYLQHHKHSEKWKRYWLNLYPGSRNGVARLELTETSSDRSPAMVRRQPDRKVIRLSECISVVRLPPHAEAHPGDNMAAFCVQTDDKRMVFAVEKEGCGEWVEKICDIAFQKGSSSIPRQVPQMEENQIYASREEVFDFWVTLQQSEAAVRCGLQGAYWLQTGEESLIIQDTESRQRVIEWQYKLLRRYGGDKTVFSIEAGRRCESGPGTFVFETKQSEEILRRVEQAIQQQKTLSVSAGSCSPRSPCSPLPRRPISASLLDTLANSSGLSSSESSANNDGPGGLADSAFVKAATGTSKTNPRLPGESTGMPEPIYSTPIDDIAFRLQQPTVKNVRPIHHPYEYTEPVYSDPADVIRPNPNARMCAWSNTTDTVSVPVPLESSHHSPQPDPLYSEVLHIMPNPAQQPVSQAQNKEEPIYSLPIHNTVHKSCEDVQTASESKSDMENKKVDEITAIYSQVNKAAKTKKPKDKTESQRVPDVVSEPLGWI
ncbi:docking protein 2-like [Astyanax mexicanus]|uniref:Docking protein 2-like n=1 Tax=Astyanax mexicanus TaxID=7994 RepID=A0A8T2M3S5_ASTMX|nr:docking protein 2-like [Astyanax mexicanus]